MCFIRTKGMKVFTVRQPMKVTKNLAYSADGGGYIRCDSPFYYMKWYENHYTKIPSAVMKEVNVNFNKHKINMGLHSLINPFSAYGYTSIPNIEEVIDNFKAGEEVTLLTEAFIPSGTKAIINAAGEVVSEKLEITDRVYLIVNNTLALVSVRNIVERYLDDVLDSMISLGL